jgi:hypothetical protein
VATNIIMMRKIIGMKRLVLIAHKEPISDDM